MALAIDLGGSNIAGSGDVTISPGNLLAATFKTSNRQLDLFIPLAVKDVSAAVDADGLGILMVIRKAIAAIAVNTDVVIYNANAPFGFTVIDSYILATTGQASAVFTLRDATAGGGNAVSSAMVAAAAGIARNAQTTALATIAAGGTLVARRTGGVGNVTGTVVVMIQRN